MTTPTPAQQLEPCPFCGSSDVHVGGMIPWVECADCGACGPVAQPVAENEIAERLWNRRIPNTRALAALDAVEWRPIESAPKDGCEFLLARGERVTFGHWLVDEGGIHEHRDLAGNWIGQDESDGYEGWMSWDGGFTEKEPPTHWMPLPAPPADAVEVSRG